MEDTIWEFHESMQNWFLRYSGKSKETNKHIKNVNSNPKKKIFQIMVLQKT